MQKMLNFIEDKGNRLPSPTMLFVWLCAFVVVLSAIASWLGVSALHPIDGQKIQAVNLLSQDGLSRMLTQTVSNFITFAPVGTVLVAIMGIGVAEHSGFIQAVLKATMLRAPKKLLSFFVVMCGVLSSLAADSGYVILIPLVALMYQALGRNPLIGIAAAFAGVSGGFSANLLVGPFDIALAGLTQEAALLVTSDASVSATSNYYFLAFSTFFISVVGAFITEKIIAPRLDANYTQEKNTSNKIEDLTQKEKYALKITALFTLFFISLVVFSVVVQSNVLQGGGASEVLKSPFLKGIVVLIAVYCVLAGIIYGRVSGAYSKVSDFIEGMEKHMATMAGYLVLMFFAAQFVNYFAWSHLGSIFAISGASFLSTLDIPLAIILVLFVLLTAVLNLFIGSGSGKWALLAPIFVPMLLLIGINPEATQMAYRIGDSTTNIITPLMPYFGVVVAFAQKYDPKTGIGTIISMMLPYSIVFLISWTLLLVVWVSFGLPLGFSG